MEIHLPQGAELSELCGADRPKVKDGKTLKAVGRVVRSAILSGYSGQFCTAIEFFEECRIANLSCIPSN